MPAQPCHNGRRSQTTMSAQCFLSFEQRMQGAGSQLLCVALQARQESGAWATPSAPGSPTAGERQLRAVLVCCDDCELPVEALLGEAAGDVLVTR